MIQLYEWTYKFLIWKEQDYFKHENISEDVEKFQTCI